MAVTPPLALRRSFEWRTLSADSQTRTLGFATFTPSVGVTLLKLPAAVLQLVTSGHITSDLHA